MHLKYFVCECVLNHTFLRVCSSEKYSLIVWFLELLAGYHEHSTRRRALARERVQMISWYVQTHVIEHVFACC
jgi:hypothetical protein